MGVLKFWVADVDAGMRGRGWDGVLLQFNANVLRQLLYGILAT